MINLLLLNWFEVLALLIISVLIVFCMICVLAVIKAKRDVRQEIKSGKSKDFPKIMDIRYDL